jgi:hypothetical protein
LGFGLTACLVAPNARAEVTLRWDAPSECPGRDDVLARIRALAGASLDRTEELSVEGRIERVAGRFSLTLLVRDDREVRTRVITSDACADLAGAAAVTLALLLGIDVGAGDTGTNDGAGGGGASGGDARSTGPRKTGAGAASERDATRANPPLKSGASSGDRPSASEQSGTASAGILVRIPVASADFGPLPEPSLGLGLGVGVRYESVRAILAGRISRRQRVRAPEPYAASGAELDRVTVELSGCYGFRSQTFEIAPCVAVALERVNASGFGEDISPQSARTTWPAVGAGAVAHAYAWESLAIFAGVTGYVELSRPKVVIEGLGVLAELESVAANIAIGAEWIF